MFLLWCPLDPLASYIYIHETSHTCQHPTRPSFAWILPLHHIIFPIIDQWSWSSNVPFYIWKKTLWSFSWMEFNCLNARTTFDFEEALYFLPLSSQKLLVSFFINFRRTNSTSIKIWFKERSIGSYVAKMLFSQVDEGFWLPILH